MYGMRLRPGSGPYRRAGARSFQLSRAGAQAGGGAGAGRGGVGVKAGSVMQAFCVSNGGTAVAGGQAVAVTIRVGVPMLARC